MSGDNSARRDKLESKRATNQTTWKVGIGAKSGTNSGTTQRNQLSSQDEVKKKITKNWRFLKNNISMANIIDPLIERGVYTPDQWMALKHKQATEGERVEEFLHHLLKCKLDTYNIFTEALRSAGYLHVFSQLEGGQKNSDVDGSPCVSQSSSGSSTNGNSGRPQTFGSNYTYQLPKKSSHLQSQTGNASSRYEAPQSTVKQEDLNQMKREITDELRRLRQDIEHGREKDQLQLQVLQQKHVEMHGDLIKAVADRKELENELYNVMETVNKLTINLESKKAEFRELQERTSELSQALHKKSADLQRMAAEKDKGGKDLMKQLSTKEADYKQLQATLEGLKGEHEERLGRMKVLNKEKVVLTKEVQNLQRERKNLEVKIKSLEEHIRVLQAKHTKEQNDTKEELERQKTLLCDKEKERSELEKKLEASTVENENLRQHNKHLENSLQKTEDAKAQLVQKAKENLAKFAIPPFTVGRMGWANKRNQKKQ